MIHASAHFDFDWPNRRGHDKAVKQNGNRTEPRLKTGSGEDRELRPADPAQYFGWRGAEHAGATASHGFPLTNKTGFVDSAPGSDPIGNFTAVKACRHCRCRGGVADSHLTQQQKVGSGPCHRLPTK